jgi:hypothetical protein
VTDRVLDHDNLTLTYACENCDNSLQSSAQRKSYEMTSISAQLSRSLPKPKYTGEEEAIPQHAQHRGPRIVGAGTLDESQIVLRVS